MVIIVIQFLSLFYVIGSLSYLTFASESKVLEKIYGNSLRNCTSLILGLALTYCIGNVPEYAPIAAIALSISWFITAGYAYKNGIVAAVRGE